MGGPSPRRSAFGKTPLHRFDSRASAESYLKSALSGNDVLRELKPYLLADPEVRIYERRGN
jgi:hypothetical protein